MSKDFRGARLIGSDGNNDVMPAPPDFVGEGIVFLDSPVVAFVRSSVRLFAWTDIVTTMSHERLEKFW